MAEQPILFSGEMVRAILENRKTQTRRAVKPQPDLMQPGGTIKPQPSDAGVFLVENWQKQDRAFLDFGRCENIRSPYAPGDTLWVREAFTVAAEEDADGAYPMTYLADGYSTQMDYSEVTEGRMKPGKTYPSIHMPRWASRITLRVTGVRVERVQEISEKDAMAEGITEADIQAVSERNRALPGAILAFRHLWSTIHAADGPNGWDANPWVWVVEFEKEGA